MRRLVFALVLISVVGLGTVLVRSGCETPVPNTPQGILTAAIESLAVQDADLTSSYFTGVAYNQMRSGLDDFFVYENIEVDNITVDLLEQSPTIAMVYIEYDLTFSAMGYSDTVKINRIVRCIKESDGQWYVGSMI